MSRWHRLPLPLTAMGQETARREGPMPGWLDQGVVYPGRVDRRRPECTRERDGTTNLDVHRRPMAVRQLLSLAPFCSEPVNAYRRGRRITDRSTRARAGVTPLGVRGLAPVCLCPNASQDRGPAASPAAALRAACRGRDGGARGRLPRLTQRQPGLGVDKGSFRLRLCGFQLCPECGGGCNALLGLSPGFGWATLVSG
jgi:hypothetical protein